MKLVYGSQQINQIEIDKIAYFRYKWAIRKTHDFFFHFSILCKYKEKKRIFSIQNQFLLTFVPIHTHDTRTDNIY